MSGTDFKSLIQSGKKAGPETKEFQASLLVKSIDEPKRQITAVVSTGTIDR